jgi:hypothetical protein
MDISRARTLIILSIGVFILLAACTQLGKDEQTRPGSEPLEAALVEEDNQATLSGPGSGSDQEISLLESAIEEPLPGLAETPKQAQIRSAMATFTPAPVESATLASPTDLAQAPTETPAPDIALAPSPTATEPLLPSEPATTVPLPPGVITGRILFHGALPTQTLTLVLEDQTYQVIQEINISNGEYVFANLPASSEGYNVLFTQSKNPQFSPSEVLSWAWIGPVPVQDGDFHVLPDLQVALVGLAPVKPADGGILKASSISAQTPLRFEWSAYPAAAQYWVELRAGSTLELVWRSNYVDTLSVDFDGTLLNGERIVPDSYWWSAGARMNEPLITISNPLRSFTLQP